MKFLLPSKIVSLFDSNLAHAGIEWNWAAMQHSCDFHDVRFALVSKKRHCYAV